jgi:hypothetical protein
LAKNGRFPAIQASRKNPFADLFLENRELHYFFYEKPPGLGGTTVD